MNTSERRSPNFAVSSLPLNVISYRSHSRRVVQWQVKGKRSFDPAATPRCQSIEDFNPTGSMRRWKEGFPVGIRHAGFLLLLRYQKEQRYRVKQKATRNRRGSECAHFLRFARKSPTPWRRSRRSKCTHHRSVGSRPAHTDTRANRGAPRRDLGEDR